VPENENYIKARLSTTLRKMADRIDAGEECGSSLSENGGCEFRIWVYFPDGTNEPRYPPTRHPSFKWPDIEGNPKGVQ